MSNDISSGYIGRFAPSPTGHIHLGTLAAAMASFLDARQQQGKWLLRIENIDPPREVAGATASIIRALEQFGFEWDGDIVYQISRIPVYQHYLDDLIARQLSYACRCSRKELEAFSDDSGVEPVYPGFCRKNPPESGVKIAYRVVTDTRRVCFTDAIQGEICQTLATDVGDFVIRRKDGYFAYQLAVVVDDAEAGITHIVRGQDLLASTPRQIYLQQLLGFKTPAYAHIPLLLDNAGQKLSKSSSNGEPPEPTVASLVECWHRLGQQPVKAREFDYIDDFWRFATQQWQLAKLNGADHE